MNNHLYSPVASLLFSILVQRQLLFLITWCCGLNCILTQNSYVEAPNPQCNST